MIVEHSALELERGPTSPPGLGHSLRPAALRSFIARMRADPAADFRTEDAAAAFGVPPFVFIRAFKKLTGLSPQRYRAALRIELAKRLLVDTDRSVTEISLDAGYNSLGTFVRTFTALVGVSPSQLRRLARGGDPREILDIAHYVDAPTASARNIRGTIETHWRGGAMAVVGLFPQGLPAGLPFDGCFIQPSAPRFSLAWPPQRQRTSLLAAAIGPFDLKDAWAGRLKGVEVCNLSLLRNRAEPASRSLRLNLRSITETDPPFLTPVPLLMMLQAWKEARCRNLLP